MIEEKKRRKRFVILGIIAILPLALCVFYFIIWFSSDRIARNTYNGLDNMFVSHDEYFAIAGPFHVMIPKFMAQTAVHGDVENISAIDETVGKKFYVQCTYSANGRPEFEGTTTLIHSYDSHYVFQVSNPGPDKYEVTREEERIMLEIAEHFYNFNTPYVRTDDNWLAGNKNHTTFLAYDVFFKDDKVFFAVDRPHKRETLYSYDNGTFLRIMSVPERGNFDLVIWK